MTSRRSLTHARVFLIALIFISQAFVFSWGHAEGSVSLSVAPSSGTFVMDSVFTVSVSLDTNGQNINALDAVLRFPPDKLQVVSPTAGKSFVQIWVTQPTYDNVKGILRFQGAIPNPGINTSQGLISQVTFRVVGLGNATVRFADSSKVLLNDGKGTNVLGQVSSGLFKLILPPPTGPKVTSETHPDGEHWYGDRTPIFHWQSDQPIEGYSYVLNDDPISAPDDIVESAATTQTYRDVGDGVHYFHIKAYAGGNWGGVTHYPIQIDGTSPADFPVEITPSPRTVQKQPTITFETTDMLSGVDHYEVRIVSLTPREGKQNDADAQNFFVEAESPYLPKLDYGEYDVIVRAYDRAGSYTQKTARLQIVPNIFGIVHDQGVQVASNFVVPWSFIIFSFLLLIIILAYLAWRSWRRHRETHTALQSGQLSPEITAQLQELKAFKERYRDATILKALVLIVLSGVLIFGRVAEAEMVELASPQVTTYPAGLSNTEIFYAGGRSVAPGSQIVLYLQNLQSSETMSMTIPVDKHGEWFYTHPSFLPPGKYVIWAQNKLGGVVSPPSAQITLLIEPAAIQFGASRFGYAIIYLVISIVLLFIILGLACFIWYHRRIERQKRGRLQAELRSAEEAIKHGFASLGRDIQNQVALLAKVKLARGLSTEEHVLEQKLKNDLEAVREIVGHELWALEREADDLS